nr:hypothetical protein CFP56_04912 [Quercus suber]
MANVGHWLASWSPMAPPLLATTLIRTQISPPPLADASIFADLDDRIASLLRCRRSQEFSSFLFSQFLFLFLCFCITIWVFRWWLMAALVLVELEVVV